MKSIRAASLGVVLILFAGVAIGKSLLETDREKFKTLFLALGEHPGYELALCGLGSKRDELIRSLEFLAAGYQKLNRKFPEPAPLRPQIDERNEIILSIYQHGKTTPDLSGCERLVNYSAPELTRSFEEESTKLKVRLAKAGFDSQNVTSKNRNPASSSDSCEMKAQYYQDRYQSGGRVNDLICMKKALDRELR